MPPENQSQLDAEQTRNYAEQTPRPGSSPRGSRLSRAGQARKTISAILLIVVLLVVGAVSAYFALSTGNEKTEEEIEEIERAVPLESEMESVDISDWQTYRNEEFGFEFKYPRDFSSFSETLGGKNIISFDSSPKNDNRAANTLNLSIISGYESINGYLALNPRSAGFTYIKSYETFISGLPAHFQEIRSYVSVWPTREDVNKPLTWFNTYIKIPTAIVRITLLSEDYLGDDPEAERLKIKKIHDQIISTFKIANKEITNFNVIL